MKIKPILISIFVISLFFFPFLSFAQDIKAKNPLEELLTLDIPNITDNPSFIINFTDPSKEKVGVEISIDEKDFVKISTPYTLPALSIGEHSLHFRFVDQYDVSQTLKKDLIVTPRPPVLNTPNMMNEEITFSGRALAASEVSLILNSSNKMVVKKATVDNDGMWTISIAEEIPDGIYTFTALTRKYGFSSELAEPLTLDVTSKNPSDISQVTKTPIYFTFKDFTENDLKELTKKHIDLLILTVGIFLIGMLIGILFMSFSKKKSEEKVVKEVAKNFEKPISLDDRPLTLLEKLKDKTVNIDNPIVEKEVLEKTPLAEAVVEEKGVLSKVDFLKNFKSHDPDNEKGKEKKDLKVSLTSKN